MDRFGIHKDPGHKCRICDVIHFLFCTTGGQKVWFLFLLCAALLKRTLNSKEQSNIDQAYHENRGFINQKINSLKKITVVDVRSMSDSPCSLSIKPYKNTFVLMIKLKYRDHYRWAVRGWRGRDRNERSIILPVNNLQTILRTHQYCCCLYQHAILHSL